MDTKEVLGSLGLGEKEALVYISLLELGEGTVLGVSRKSGVKRPTAYLTLEALESRGFVTRTKRGGKTLFVPQPPRKLVSEMEFRLRELREIMPQLESLSQKGSGKPRVVIYEGKEALDRVYDEVFVIKGELLYIGNLKLFEEAFPRTLKKFHYVSYSPEFSVRGILYDTEEARAYAKVHDNEYQHTKFIPRDFSPFQVDIGIFGQRALLSSIGGKDYFAVSIESEEVANAFRTIFEMIWRSAQA